MNTGQCESNPNVYNGTLIIANDCGIMYVINATRQIINETNIGTPHLGNEFIFTKNYAIMGGLNGLIKSIPINALLTEKCKCKLNLNQQTALYIAITRFLS